jgi:hypothetical protein
VEKKKHCLQPLERIGGPGEGRLSKVKREKKHMRALSIK